MELTRQPAAVLSDMDGLLLDTERLYLDCFIRAGAVLGLADKVDLHAAFLSCIGLRGDVSDQVLNDWLGAHIALVDFMPVWDADIAKVKARGIPVKPQAQAFLRGLAALDVPVVIVTSTRAAQATDYLDAVGLLPLVQGVIGGDQVTQPKPHPEPYHAGAALLGVPVQDCVAFEDSDTGTRAAVASGARVVQVPDLKQPAPEIVSLGHVIAPDLLSGARVMGLHHT